MARHNLLSTLPPPLVSCRHSVLLVHEVKLTLEIPYMATNQSHKSEHAVQQYLQPSLPFCKPLSLKHKDMWPCQKHPGMFKHF